MAQKQVAENPKFAAKKGEKAKTTKKTSKRLYLYRMYRLPDGEYFFYFGKWDSHGKLIGKVYDGSVDHLLNKIVHRSLLEESELIPKGEEPWVMASHTSA